MLTASNTGKIRESFTLKHMMMNMTKNVADNHEDMLLVIMRMIMKVMKKALEWVMMMNQL